MEFDLSNFQVWKSMEKINQSMEKYLCFQTIVPIVFSNIKLRISKYKSYNQSFFKVFGGTSCLRCQKIGSLS